MDIPEIDTDDAALALESQQATFMDVRDGASFTASHVPGAVHVTDASIEDFLEDTDRQRQVIVYCYHGHNSLGGAAYLLSKGFEHVASMRGGFEAWRGKHPEQGG